MKTLIVQAVKGISVPLEGHSRRFITDASAQEVPDTVYYHRRIADGDLTLIPKKANKNPSHTPKGEKNG